MALCEGHPDWVMPQLKADPDSESENVPESPEKKPDLTLIGHPNASTSLSVPLTVDYRSPRSHFVPPEVEMYAVQASHRMTSSSQDEGSTTSLSTVESNTSGVPAKRKRGRPRVDKTSPEYIAKSVARKQVRDIGGSMNSTADTGEKRKRGRPRVDKTSPEYLARKRAKEIEALEKEAKRQFRRRTTGARVVTKAVTKMPARIKKIPTRKVKIPVNIRKLPNKSGKGIANRKSGSMSNKKVVIRRSTKFVKRKKKDSGASSSTGEGTPHAKRKYTKRPPMPGQGGSEQDGPKKRGRKKKTILGPDGQPVTPPVIEKVKGRRGRPRKSELLAAGLLTPNSSTKRPTDKRIYVRNNLMPINSEPIPVDSDDEPALGSPGQASDSLSFDENLRALRHLHEKYANIGRDDLYEAHLLAANFRRPPHSDGYGSLVNRFRSEDLATNHIPFNNSNLNNDQDDVVSVRSSEGRESVAKESEPKIEKLEDSSNSDSDSSSSGSGSSSSGSSSSSSSGSSSSSDSSDSESEASKNGAEGSRNLNNVDSRQSRSPQVQSRPEDDGSFGAWSFKTGSRSDSGSDSDPERLESRAAVEERTASLSESENESPDKSFQCTVCKKWYSTIVTLKIHRRVHLNRGGSGGGSRSRARSKDRYECDCCPEVFSRREKLWEHKAEAHRGSMTARCEVCRRCFEDDAELAAHESAHTADERAGRCSDCGATFQRFDQLRRHRACAHPSSVPPRSSHQYQHTCPQCGKGFGHAHSLTRHLHNHAKQLYRCVVCKASFGRADQLAQHLNSHLANYRRLKP